MAILTLDIPDTLAQTVATLSEAERAVYIARLNAFAAATLPKVNALQTAPGDEAEDEDDLPDDIYLIHPLPPSLTQSLADDMREAFADVEAGRIIKGDVALAELRRYVGQE